MNRKRLLWIGLIIVCMMMAYAVWNIVQVRRDLVRGDAYYRRLTESIQAVAAENQRLEEAIAKSHDPATIEREARLRLGLVRPGEIIFCGTD